MSDKKLLQTIQEDIKNLDKCIEMCDTEEGVDYLKSIQQNLREQEIKLVKKWALKKLLRSTPMIEFMLVICLMALLLLFTTMCLEITIDIVKDIIVSFKGD